MFFATIVNVILQLLCKPCNCYTYKGFYFCVLILYLQLYQTVMSSNNQWAVFRLHKQRFMSSANRQCNFLTVQFVSPSSLSVPQSFWLKLPGLHRTAVVTVGMHVWFQTVGECLQLCPSNMLLAMGFSQISLTVLQSVSSMTCLKFSS